MQYNVDEKRYRLSKAIAYDAYYTSGWMNFCGLKLVFSSTDQAPGRPDKEYLFGRDDLSDIG